MSDAFFADHPESRELFEAVHRAILSFGPSEMRVTKSQIAFRRRVGFAWAWMPSIALRRKAAPLVLTIGLKRRDPSHRWKEVVQASSTKWVHHLEVYSTGDIDEEVLGWLREAWETAGMSR